MNNLYRGPSIDASYQVSVHLAKLFQRRRFLKIGQSETRIAAVAMFVNGSGQNEHLYKGPSIDASYQVSVHLAEGFQRRRLKCEKLTDDKWWQKLTLPNKWQGELKKKKKEFGKDADLRIPLNWTVIRDNDVSGCRLETELRSESIIYMYIVLLINT